MLQSVPRRSRRQAYRGIATRDRRADTAVACSWARCRCGARSKGAQRTGCARECERLLEAQIDRMTQEVASRCVLRRLPTLQRCLSRRNVCAPGRMHGARRVHTPWRRLGGERRAAQTRRQRGGFVRSQCALRTCVELRPLSEVRGHCMRVPGLASLKAAVATGKTLSGAAAAALLISQQAARPRVWASCGAVTAPPRVGCCWLGSTAVAAAGRIALSTGWGGTGRQLS